jgi:predicted lipoprotein with Yx(FWY)xxD motif
MSKTLWGVIILIVIVAAGWYFYYKSSDTYTAPATTATQTTNTAPVTTAPATATAPNHDNIYLTSTSTTKGTYMTDFAGKTLYTFDNDTTPGQSSCTGACATLWPAYTSGATAQSALPDGITVITRADGSTQFAWQGKPLYYYSKDTAPGQLKGDGIGGIWHIVKM